MHLRLLHPLVNQVKLMRFFRIVEMILHPLEWWEIAMMILQPLHLYSFILTNNAWKCKWLFHFTLDMLDHISWGNIIR